MPDVRATFATCAHLLDRGHGRKTDASVTAIRSQAPGPVGLEVEAAEDRDRVLAAEPKAVDDRRVDSLDPLHVRNVVQVALRIRILQVDRRGNDALADCSDGRQPAHCAGRAEEMARDPRIFVLGEGIGRRGGNFGTTAGLFQLYGPERLRDTPICERGFVGLAAGAAMAGARPVVDFMFADFILDAFGEPVDIPMVGKYVSFVDTEGNRVSILQPSMPA